MLEKMAPKRVRKRRLIIICAALLILFLAVPSRGRRGLNNIPPAVAVGADTNAINGHQHDIDMNEDSSPSMDDDDAGLVAEENDLQQQTQQHYNLKDDQGRPPPLPQPHHQQQQQPILNANILERHPPSHNNPVQEEDDSDNDDGPPPAPAIPNNFDQQHQPLNKDVDKKPRVDAFGRVRKPPSAEDTEPNDVDGEVAKIDGKFEPLHHQEKGENEKVVLKIHERQSDEREEVLQMDDKDGDDIEEEPQRDVEKKDVEEGECQRSEDGLCLNKALEKPDEAQNDSDKIQLPVKDDDIPLDKAPHHLNNDTITPDSLKWRFVCIIGNSQRIDDALRSHKMWGSIFPSFWYIWGKEDPTTPDSIKLTQSSTSDPLLQTHFHIYRTPDKKTWSQGIAHLLPLARQKYACEYIFTHDDDLDFSAKDRRPLHEVLVTLLATHQPAVAGFPWTVGDQSNDGTRRIEAAFNESDVAPLAYFDSGMVLYHHSIVDLFIPYAPRGEGGFHGDWSLCAHFLNLFAPFTFKGAAVRFNALTYRNMISLDNVPVDQRAVVEVTEEGLAVHEGSRHPYEYVFNKKYMAFLSSGMHGLSVRWGRGMEPYDVHWRVETPSVPSLSITDLIHTDKRPPFRTFPATTVLDNISAFYDLSHDALSGNAFLQSLTKNELRHHVDGRGEGAFRFEIHVFTMDRRESFDRLWSSINAANPITRNIRIIIHVDRPNATYESRAAVKDFKEYMTHLRSLTSSHGGVELRQSTSVHGLRQMMLDAWTPNDRRTFAVFLEDDVEVSPHFLEYAEQMVGRYLFPGASREQGSERCMGISLYNLRYEEVNERGWVPETGPEYRPYVLQHPQSWGAVWVPDAWSQFIGWVASLPNDFEPLIPMSLTNRWPRDRSWKKYLMRFMVETGRYMVYPNFPGNYSLSTNHVEVGTNEKAGKRLEELRGRFRVPLLKLAEIVGSSAAVVGVTERELFYLRSVAVIGERVGLNLTAGAAMTTLNTFGKVKDGGEERKNDDTLDDAETSVDAVQKTKSRRILPPLIPSSHVLPSLKSLEVFDSTFQPSLNITTLLTTSNPTAFDKCTMVMPVFSRHATLLDRLEYYHTHPLLSSIIVVWNNPTVQPPSIAPHISSRKRAMQYKKKKKGKLNVFFIPIHIKIQPFNSMNNRYLPFPELTTDCVVSMDDDWDMPHDHITFAIQLWQAQFFNHIVGFKHLGRQHFRGRDGKWNYRKADDAVSIMLPSGAVYHRRFHSIYSYVLPASSRRTVDQLTNCDDILFNMMVANTTGNAPVVIDVFAKSLDMGGLWKEPDHLKKRSECLQEFSRDVFGGMPLRYSLSVVKGRKANGVLPSLRELVVVSELGSGGAETGGEVAKNRVPHKGVKRGRGAH